MNEKEIISAAMSLIGRRKSPKKSLAARRNGKLGGRPKRLKNSELQMQKNSW